MKPALPKRHNQRGYILITLMLFVALLAVASLAWIEKVDFQIKRDREEELIHRGVQYSRAIKRYVKKFGTYPANIEALEKTNDLRFLRKRYKDPITGKDFKLLRMNDVQMSFAPAAPAGIGGGPGQNAFAAGQGALQGTVTTSNGSSTTGSGVSSMSVNTQPPQQAGSNDASNSDQPGQDASGDPNSPQNPPTSKQQDQNGGPGTGPTIGGLPIVGVASTSKDKTIRQFNKKDHYNEWQFTYDATSDRGGLLTTPSHPGMQGATQVNLTNTNQPQNNGPTSVFGAGQGGVNAPGMNPSGNQPSPAQPEPDQQQ